jgi:hypothetical protein
MSLDVLKLQKKIDEFHYWDARVLQVTCDYFADEMSLIYEDEEDNVCYDFIGCYRISFDHCLTYEKTIPPRQLLRSQIPYFLQNVVVEEEVHADIKFYTCKIDMFPINLEVLCKDIIVKRINKMS